jgi:hypothetical protein
MGIAGDEGVPLDEAGGRRSELANEVVGRDVERVLIKNGASYVALVPARKLDYYHALEAEHAGPVLAEAALDGLEDLAADRVLDEAALDRALLRRESGPSD